MGADGRWARFAEYAKAYAVGGAKAVIDAASGGYDTDVWALAMCVEYGPVGLHESRFGSDGRPDPEKCADCPSVFDFMAECRAKLEDKMGVSS